MEEDDANPFVNMLLQQNKPEIIDENREPQPENFQNIGFVVDHHSSKKILLFTNKYSIIYFLLPDYDSEFLIKTEGCENGKIKHEYNDEPPTDQSYQDQSYKYENSIFHDNSSNLSLSQELHQDSQSQNEGEVQPPIKKKKGRPFGKTILEADYLTFLSITFLRGENWNWLEINKKSDDELQSRATRQASKNASERPQV